MNYGRYKAARDAAWNVLIENRVKELPVKVTAIATWYGLTCCSYSAGAEILKACGALDHCAETDGFLLRAGTDRAIVFFDDGCSRQRCRFTIAHEIGHWVLGHELAEGVYTLINREPAASDNPQEHEANVFASRILAPACVLWALNIHSPEEIAELCDISLTSAAFRAERMAALYDREREFLARTGRSCFLQSPQEREVYAQFAEFIKSQSSPKE